MTQDTLPTEARDPAGASTVVASDGATSATGTAPLPVLEHPAERPTLVRYGVLMWLCTLALLLYVDRICIGQAMKPIQDELGLSKVQIAWVLNAFTLAYCLFEVPTGHWGDRYGSRGVITRIVIWWSVFTALTGAAWGVYSLVAIRFLFGAGEAGAYPNAARVVPRWFPQSSRGLARGAITFTSFIGAAIAPPLAAYLIGRVGWRATFGIFGAVGIVWAIAFYWWFRDDPAEHRSTNAAERNRILAGRTPDDAEPAAGEHARIPWPIVLTSPSMWLLSTAMGVSAMCMYMQFQWFPTYLKEARGEGEQSSGWMTGSVMLGGALGCVVGGLLADWVTRKSRNPRTTDRLRRLCGGGSLLLAALSIVGVRFADSAGAVTLCNSAALFFVQVAIPTWWTVVAGISGRHGAAMWGLMNSMAAFGILATTFFVGWWIDRGVALGWPVVAAWEAVFDVVAASLFIGAVCWLAVNTRRSIVSRENGALSPVPA